ncbi:MAG: hypothetical protein ABGU93_09720 [Acetobacterium sp.]
MATSKNQQSYKKTCKPLVLWMIYAGEYVYWINSGPSFAEAKQAVR